MSAEASGGVRWWESYLVRYALGFIVGTYCVLQISALLFPDFPNALSGASAAFLGLAGSATAKDASDGNFAFVVIFAGIAYCYIVSAPIMVWHAGRMVDSWADQHAIPFWIAWVALVVATAIYKARDLLAALWNRDQDGHALAACVVMFLAALGLVLLHRCWHGKKFGTDPIVPEAGELKKTVDAADKDAWQRLKAYGWLALLWFVLLVSAMYALNALGTRDNLLFVLSLPAFWMWVDQYAVLYALHRRSYRVDVFYGRLTQVRRLAESRDMRDTYTHLREHANAVLIVLAELSLLAFFLWCSEQPWWTIQPAAGSHPLVQPGAWIVMVGCALWLLPATFMWGWANRMERWLVENPPAMVGEGK